MRAKFLGDSYDLAKRFFLATLRPMGPWAVHPMFTVEDEPPPTELPNRFERLLDAKLIDAHVLRDATSRRESLAKCVEADHLFLDPDTGLRVAAGKRRPSVKHIEGEELLDIVRARPGRLTIVFDQAFSRANIEEQLRRKLRWLEARGVLGFAYRSHACFIFLASEKEVIERALSLLGEAGLPESRFVGAEGNARVSSTSG